MITKPLIFAVSALRLNYSTSASGSIAVEIQDAEGTPVDGFGLSDMTPFYGDALDEAVIWRGGGDLSKLDATPVRFRFVIADADLFSFRVK
jgi:hypothetical protein